jgi:hypothetical protein
MAKENEIRRSVPVERLVKGLFVDLGLSWSEHPFLFSRFKIKSDKDIAAIRQLGLTHIDVILEFSDVELPEEAATGVPEEPGDSLQALWRRKREQVSRASQYRNRRNNVSKRYHEKAMAVRKIARDLTSQPANAIREAHGFVESLAVDFESQGDLLTNLVNLSGWEHSYYNHSVNVAILSLMLAAAEGHTGASCARSASAPCCTISARSICLPRSPTSAAS